MKVPKNLIGLNGFFIIGLVIILIRIIYIAANNLDLYPDEAQYWIWSKSLSFGYYSKPPVIAWIIYLSTSVCGNGEFCVRLAAPILHLATATIIYKIAEEVADRKIATLSSITYLTLPAVTLSSALITTDVPLLFFWALALYFFILADKYRRSKWWAVSGMAIGFGMLSKYSMVVFLISAVIYLLLSERKKLKGRDFIAFLALSFLIFLPNIIWNLSNGLVSFSHTWSNISGEGRFFNFNKFLEFFGAQFGVFGPVLFFVLVSLLIIQPRNFIKRNRVLLYFTSPLLLIAFTVSFISRAHANWAAPAYISGTILVVLWLVEKKKEYLVYASLVIHILAAIVFYNYSWLAEVSGAKNDPFRRLRGWRELAIEVNKIHKLNPERIIFTDDRETLASLKYYLRSRDGAPAEIMKWNSDRRIDDHFDMTSDVNEEKGRDMLFVANYDDVEKLAPYFTSVKKIKDIRKIKQKNKNFRLYSADGFKGY